MRHDPRRSCSSREAEAAVAVSGAAWPLDPGRALGVELVTEAHPPLAVQPDDNRGRDVDRARPTECRFAWKAAALPEAVLNTERISAG
jgi:hypothetical protein